MSTALIIVDVQNDFCEGGSLAVAGGADVAAKISEFAGLGRYDYVVATRDHHIDPGDHFSGTPDFVDSWPPHCVVGTPGAQFHPAFSYPALDAIFDKGAYSAAYSGFEGSCDDVDLRTWLTERGVTLVDVVGIAYDYCVHATAMDAARFGFDTRVLHQLTVPVSHDNDAKVAADFARAGVDIVN